MPASANILIKNYNEVVLQNYCLAVDGTPVNDAVVVFTVFQQDGLTPLPGLSNVSMPSTGSGGNYRGPIPNTSPITLSSNGAQYRIEVDVTNYGDQFVDWFNAVERSSSNPNG